MPPKKRSWGDIPHIDDIEDMDTNGKLIHCKICDVRIRVRSQFSSSEWQIHTDGVKHSQLCNTNALKNVPKLITFFKTKQNDNNLSPKPSTPPKKRPKTISCPGFYHGKNSDLLPFMLNTRKQTI